MKYIIVTGGVCSSLGKGVTMSSLGAVLRARGFHVNVIKIDPYINVDAGLMSPFEHGEVFVLEDGGEADLDLGNYERMLDLTLNRDNNITTGKMFKQLIELERTGAFLGKTVQIIPHFTDMVREHIERVAHQCADQSGVVPDFCLIEVGGTVGDVESMPFLESLRLKRAERYFSNDFCLIHMSYVPWMDGQKTKPTQHSVHKLQGLGLQPDLVCCRSPKPLEAYTKEKISMLSNLPADCVISLHDVDSVYEVPQLLDDQCIVEKIARVLRFDIDSKSGLEKFSLSRWKNLCITQKNSKRSVRIAFVGKYLDIRKGTGSDTYLSAVKALEHSGVQFDYHVEIMWISATDLEVGSDTNMKAHAEDQLSRAHGIFLPGGFGDRGTEGIIATVNYARTKLIPFFGVCLGMQFCLIEYARTKLGYTNANSEEINSTTENIIKSIQVQDNEKLGASMRLGGFPVRITPNSLLSRIYCGATKISERHRHRYEFNNDYLDSFEQAGLIFSGKGEQNIVIEAIELPQDIHPFFLATQYHPEYKTRPFDPSPPFSAFVAAAISFESNDFNFLNRFLSEQKSRNLDWRYRPSCENSSTPIQ